MVDFVALPQAGQTYFRNVVFVTSWHSFVSSFVVSGKSVAVVAFSSLARKFSAIDPTFRAEFGAGEAFCAKVVDVVSWIGQPAYGESLARQGHGKHYTFACHSGRRRAHVAVMDRVQDSSFLKLRFTCCFPVFHDLLCVCVFTLHENLMFSDVICLSFHILRMLQ